MSTDQQTVPPRHYSREQLAKLLEVSSKVECECPNHLAGIVAGLVAFEDYAANCENLNEADRELHAFLHAETAGARHIMEKALVHLVEIEGIQI